MRFHLFIAVGFLFGFSFPSIQAQEWQPPRVVLPANLKHPVIALPPGGLEILRSAYRGDTEITGEVKKMVAAGEKAIRPKLSFPPRGGHHNQWYQCDKCQRALKTVNGKHTCPTCGKVYAGEPYDDVVFSRQHAANLRRMRDAAWAYAITQDEKFAEFAKTVLVGYGERYLTYPYRQASRADNAYARKAGGRLFDQTLTEAGYLHGSIAEGYDLIHDSPSVTAADHKKIREGLFLPMLESIGTYSRGKGNWQTFHNAAMFWGGAVLGDVKWMERSINDPKHGFIFQMGESVSPDGMWYEGSWSYHFYTLSGLANHARGAAHLGIDLWGNPMLKKMFLLPVSYEMSDGSVPRLGDSTTLRPERSWQRMADMTEAAFSYYQDEDLLSILPKKITRFSYFYGNEKADRTRKLIGRTVVFPETGHAILRTNGGGKLSAALTFAPHGGGHGHYDKLSFVLFGFDEELAVDRGRASSQAYRLPIHRAWYKSTISHNTVLVDGKDQKPSPGELLFHQANAEYAAIVTRNNEAYPGVEHRRMLFLTPDYLLVFDDLQADKPRQFDWFYHNRGDRTTTPVRLSPANLDGRGPGFAYIEDAAAAPLPGAIAATFPGKKVNVQFLAAPGSGTTLTTGHGPGTSIAERVSLLFLSRKSAQEKFAVIIEPVPVKGKAKVSSVSWEETPNGIEIVVQRDGGFDQFLLTPEHRASVRFDPRR